MKQISMASFSLCMLLISGCSFNAVQKSVNYYPRLPYCQGTIVTLYEDKILQKLVHIDAKDKGYSTENHCLLSWNNHPHHKNISIAQEISPAKFEKGLTFICETSSDKTCCWPLADRSFSMCYP